MRESLSLKLASWIPGSYMIREFAKHVLSVNAYLMDHQSVSSTRAKDHKASRSLDHPVDHAVDDADLVQRIEPGARLVCGLKVLKSAKAQWQIAHSQIADSNIEHSQIPKGKSLHSLSAQQQTSKTHEHRMSKRDVNLDEAKNVGTSLLDPRRYSVYVEAVIYAWDLSVRGAHLDQNHGFFNPTSLCLRLEGAEELACEVKLVAPKSDEVVGSWELATTLDPVPGETQACGFGRYRANNYDELADHPFEMGTFSKFHFLACNIPHALVVTGRHRFDADRVCHDLKKICETQIQFFEPSGQAPFNRYLFLLTVVGDGYGGLEHRNSTALICRRDDLPPPNSLKRDETGVPLTEQDEPSEAYRRFLGLASHEYFHSWHVKRIKPAAFARYDFDSENYTRLLWVFEGFTSYYDDLLVLRAGVISKTSYLKSLESTINQVLRNPARHVQSLSDSSFDAWIKYYRQDENAANAVVSYYAKGALVALCIDLLIREQTSERYSLDDLMRFLWKRYGVHFYTDHKGLPEDGFIPALLEACDIKDGPKGAYIASEVCRWVDGTSELPLERLLAGTNVVLSQRDIKPSFGFRYRMQHQDMMIISVLVDSPAHRAGLAAGDQLLAVDGLRASESSLKEALQRCQGPIDLVAFRRDELFTTQIEPSLDANPEISLSFGSLGHQ